MWLLTLWCVAALVGAEAGAADLARGDGAQVAAESAQAAVQRPAAGLIDGDPATTFRWEWANGGAEAVIDLGRPARVEEVRIQQGPGDSLCRFVTSIEVSGHQTEWRKVSDRWPLVSQPAAWTAIPLRPCVCRYVKLAFASGSREDFAEVASAEVIGKPQERLRIFALYWGDLPGLAKCADDVAALGVTDLLVSWVDGPAVCSWHQGLDAFVDSGAKAALDRAGLRYWLDEHELCSIIRTAADIGDDLIWDQACTRARQCYAGAKELGFAGASFDPEHYYGDYHAWGDTAQYGTAGLYYRRGHQLGRAMAEVWPGMQTVHIYEARIYGNFQGVGDPNDPNIDYSQGHMWWLKGMKDAGIGITLGLEKTYGAGEGEVLDALPEAQRAKVQGAGHLFRWFGHKPDWYINLAWQAYPFVDEIIPGFNPWSVSEGDISGVRYRPEYLREQLEYARANATACWMYWGGWSSNPDPAACWRGKEPGAYLAPEGVDLAAYAPVLREFGGRR